jgi:hypothetical protein
MRRTLGDEGDFSAAGVGVRLVDSAGLQRDQVLRDAAMRQRRQNGVVVDEQVAQVAELGRHVLGRELEDEVGRRKLFPLRQLGLEVQVAQVGTGRYRHPNQRRKNQHHHANELRHDWHSIEIPTELLVLVLVLVYHNWAPK